MSTDAPAAPAAPAAPEAPAAPDAPVAESETVESTGDGRGRPKQNKTDYRGKDDPKLNEWPTDFDARVHKPLHAEDFEAEDVFWDYKAKQYDKKAIECRKNADLFRKFGSSENRKAVEKVAKMQDKIAQLRAELEASGIKLDADGNVIS